MMIAEIETFFQVVMGDLGYEGWTLNWTPSDAYCWRQDKVIDICPMDSLEECKQLLLHEIAHIDLDEPTGCQHVLRFWVCLQGLIQKYMRAGLGPYQTDMANWYCPEFVQKEMKDESRSIRQD